MYSSISKNKRMTVVLFTMFIAIISGVGLFFAYAAGDYSIFWTTLVGAIIYAGFQYFLSTTIALSMAGAQEVDKSQAPELYAAVESLSISAGLPMPKVYIMQDSAPNAFAAGTNPDNSVVCATTGLLEIMDKRELEGVVAHELSHIKNYDIRLSMAAVALTAAIGFIADMMVRMAFRINRDERKSGGAMIISWLIGMFFVMISTILASIVRMAISREREYLADMSAVMITRDPDGMIGALRKLQEYSLPIEVKSSAISGLFISNPLKSGFFSNMFSTHPPLEKRIERLQNNAERF